MKAFKDFISESTLKEIDRGGGIFKIGDTFTTSDGHTIKITDANFNYNPRRSEIVVYFDYEYTTAAGKSGKSNASASSMAKMMSGD